MKRLVVMLGILFIFGCSPKNNVYSNTYSGTLELTEHVLGSKIAGRIITLSVKEGDLVKVGQVLSTIDRYEQSKKDYERTVSLYKEGGVNAQSVEYAQLAMEDQQIVSPIDGVVLVKTVEIGEIVPAGAGIVVVGNPKDQWIKIFLPESLIGQVSLGQVASINVDGLNKTYQGRVIFIATQGEFTPRNLQSKEERITQSFALKVALDHPDEFVHPGVSAEVTFRK